VKENKLDCLHGCQELLERIEIKEKLFKRIEGIAG